MRWLFGTLSVFFGLAVVLPADALTITQSHAGRIVASEKSPTKLWYVDPVRRERASITTLADIRVILRERATRIKKRDLARIPLQGTKARGDVAYRRRVAGRFLIVTDNRNEAWYVNPTSKRRQRLGSGQRAVDFVNSRRQLVTEEVLKQIPLPPAIRLLVGNVSTARGVFKVERLVFEWNDPHLRLMTDTANTSDCKGNCPVLSLGQYVSRRKAIAGMHGTYFCPQDYAACFGRRNSYMQPVYNAYLKKWMNRGRIKFTAEPLVVFDSSNKPYMFLMTQSFPGEKTIQNTLQERSQTDGGTGILQAGFSNGPALRYEGKNALQARKMDRKQATVRSARGGLGWSGTTMTLFVAHGATVTDLASVAAALRLDYAVNLDGGGSTAMYKNSNYILGPGRNLPNAILIQRK